MFFNREVAVEAKPWCEDIGIGDPLVKLWRSNPSGEKYPQVDIVFQILKIPALSQNARKNISNLNFSHF